MERLNKSDIKKSLFLIAKCLSRNIVVERNNSEKRGGEGVFFSFSSPQFSMQSEISRKNVFVSWGVVKSYHLYLTFYSKEIWKLIPKCDNLLLHSVTTQFITKCTACYTKVRQLFCCSVFCCRVRPVLLQSATDNTKCGRYYKGRWLLQVRQNGI